MSGKPTKKNPSNSRIRWMLSMAAQKKAESEASGRAGVGAPPAKSRLSAELEARDVDAVWKAVIAPARNPGSATPPRSSIFEPTPAAAKPAVKRRGSGSGSSMTIAPESSSQHPIFSYVKSTEGTDSQLAAQYKALDAARGAGTVNL